MKEDAAQVELTDLLDIGTASQTNLGDQSMMSTSFVGSEINVKQGKSTKQLDKIDKVYSEMKNKNKKLKKEKELLK